MHYSVGAWNCSVSFECKRSNLSPSICSDNMSNLLPFNQHLSQYCGYKGMRLFAYSNSLTYRQQDCTIWLQRLKLSLFVFIYWTSHRNILKYHWLSYFINKYQQHLIWGTKENFVLLRVKKKAFIRTRKLRQLMSTLFNLKKSEISAALYLLVWVGL